MVNRPIGNHGLGIFFFFWLHTLNSYTVDNYKIHYTIFNTKRGSMKT